MENWSNGVLAKPPAPLTPKLQHSNTPLVFQSAPRAQSIYLAIPADIARRHRKEDTYVRRTATTFYVHRDPATGPRNLHDRQSSLHAHRVRRLRWLALSQGQVRARARSRPPRALGSPLHDPLVGRAPRIDPPSGSGRQDRFGRPKA